MTMIESIAESRRLGDAYLNSARLKEMCSDAKVLSDKIKEKNRDYFMLFRDVKAMQEAGLIEGNVIADIVDMLENLKSSVEDGNYSCDKVNIITRECNRVQENVNNNWNRYVKKEVGTQRDIVETLRVLVEDTQRYLTLNNIYNAIVSSKSPADPEILSKMSTYKMLTDKMIEELELKESIFNFFKKLAVHNVLSLKELSPEVLAWIQENDFEDKFIIKISDR